MGRIILAVSLFVSLPAFADTYKADFNAQVKQVTAKAKKVGNDLKVESVGIEDLESMRIRIEG